MKKKANNISKEQALEMQIKLLKENIKQLEKENADLKAQLARKYRRTSEAISSDQLLLFNEAEFNVEDGILNDNSDDLPEDNSAADTSVLSDKAKRKYVKRKSQYSMLNLPADMPVTVIHNQGKAPICDFCGTTKVKVGERVHDTIVKTTSYSIVRRITDVYECPKCDGSGKSTPKTDNILENTVVDPLMLADILNSKFNMGVPLYRQERLFNEQGVKITRHLMSALIMYVGKKIIDNLEPVLEEEVFKMPLINADETPMKVIQLYDEDGNKKAPNSRDNSFIIGRIGVDDNGSPGYSIFTFSDETKDNLGKENKEESNSYIFAGAGADVSAFFFSLIASCRNLGINPTDYLAHLFLNCNMVKSGDREAWRALLPGKCKLDDVIELRKKIAEAKPLEGRTEPYVLRGRNN